MLPAVLMALFTKSSAATLPVTMQSAEMRLGVNSKNSRFVLPLCTTINMNGCAAFITVTSLFVLQKGGMTIDFATMATWVIIAVISAIGNAGVPMGVLLPDALAYDGHGCSGCSDGCNPPRLHNHRHDRDSRKRLIRILRLRHDRP